MSVLSHKPPQCPCLVFGGTIKSAESTSTRKGLCSECSVDGRVAKSYLPVSPFGVYACRTMHEVCYFRYFGRHIVQLVSILNLTQADMQEWQTHLAMLFDQCHSRMLFMHYVAYTDMVLHRKHNSRSSSAAVALTKSNFFLASDKTRT